MLVETRKRQGEELRVTSHTVIESECLLKNDRCLLTVSAKPSSANEFTTPPAGGTTLRSIHLRCTAGDHWSDRGAVWNSAAVVDIDL